MLFEDLFILFARVSVLWLQFTYLLEGQHCHFHLAERYISLTFSIVSLDVVRIEFNSFTAVKERQLVFFQFKTGERSVAVEDSFFFSGYLAENGLCVLLGSLLEFFYCNVQNKS